ncbi:hypothetical protein IH601_01435, partial [Candidatus Bipolaricaulota bacterium]|nr:hypothetical protein [Candidatus Bipolaricaulota bacterium]
MVSRISETIAYVWIPDTIRPWSSRRLCQSRIGPWASESIELLVASVFWSEIANFKMQMRATGSARVEVLGDQVAGLDDLTVQVQAADLIEVQIDGCMMLGIGPFLRAEEADLRNRELR